MLGRVVIGAALTATTCLANQAVAQTAQSTGAQPAEDQVAPQTFGSSDIIVTANKRAERQLDVPSAITALRGDDLLDQGYASFKDYLALVPSVQVSLSGGGGAPIIRGLTTGTNVGAIVGIVVDGAPVGPSSSFALGGANSTDIDPIDLERVEVLKGPQGTLYGANTLGGLISYTFARPDLNAFTGTVRAELSGTQHGGTSYSLRGAVSAPVARGVAGIRLSGYIDRPSGFIDNSVAGISDQNHQRNWGINGAIRVEPSADLSINLVGMYQDVDQRAQDYVVYNANGGPTTGELRYDQGLLPTYRKKSRFAVGTIDYRLGFADLTSVTSYQDIDSNILINQSNGAFATTLPLLALFGGPPVPPGTLIGARSYSPTTKFTQELRLTSAGEGALQYVIGAFYTDERNEASSGIIGFTPNRSPIAALDPAIGFGLRNEYEEIAGFANATFAFSDAFDVTGGLRIGRIRQSYGQTFYGSDAAAFNTLLSLSGLPPVPADSGDTRGSETVESYLATARYHFSRDGMIYARYATGFRPGGPNFAVPGLPTRFQSDSTRNFEVGIKSKFWGGRGTIDLSAFHTRWKDILISVAASGLNGYANGGVARVMGVEGTASLEPVAGLVLRGTVAYNDGKITEIDPLAIGSVGVGDRLPNSPRWSGSLALDYRTPVGGDWSATFNVTGKFVGERHSALASSLVLVDHILPAYSLFDARVGLEGRDVQLDLFVRNLTDERAQLSAVTTPGFIEVIIQRPRTIGAAVTFRY